MEPFFNQYTNPLDGPPTSMTAFVEGVPPDFPRIGTCRVAMLSSLCDWSSGFVALQYVSYMQSTDVTHSKIDQLYSGIVFTGFFRNVTCQQKSRSSRLRRTKSSVCNCTTVDLCIPALAWLLRSIPGQSLTSSYFFTQFQYQSQQR